MANTYSDNFWTLDFVERQRILWPYNQILVAERMSTTLTKEVHRMQCNTVDGFLSQFLEEDRDG